MNLFGNIRSYSSGILSVPPKPMENLVRLGIVTKRGQLWKKKIILEVISILMSSSFTLIYMSLTVQLKGDARSFLHVRSVISFLN